MHRSPRLSALALVCLASCALAQGPPGGPPAPVRYAQARTHALSPTLRLPGTVESTRISLVAAAYSGLVEELPIEVGARVEQGQVLAELDRRSLALRRAALAAQRKEAQTRLNAARQKTSRARELSATGIISRQSLDDVQEDADAWQARIESLDAEIRSIDRDLETCTIRAPFAGLIAGKRTELGQWLRTGDPVAELVSLDDLQVVVHVPESEIARVRQGGPVRIAYDALPGLQSTGKITAIVAAADLDTRSFPVRIAVENSGRRLGVGMTASVTLGSPQARSATIVPKDALVIQGEKRTIFVLGDDNKVVPHPVRVGAGVGEWVEVAGAVRPGQRVVTRGNERLRPGQVVNGEGMEYSLP
jgi:RND family efflux transporter MFP subunit